MIDETPKALTHDEIVNYSSLGDKPSDDYMRVVDMLDNVVRECMYVSRSYGGILLCVSLVHGTCDQGGDSCSDHALHSLGG